MKIDVPPGQFERSIKRFFRMVRSEGIAREVMDRKAFRSPGESDRLKRRRAIKRQAKIEAERAELDAATTAPLTYVERLQDRLRQSNRTHDRGRT